MSATHSVRVDQIYDIITKGNKTEKVQKVADIYNEVTLSDIVSYFTTVETENALANKVLSFDISEVLSELATNNLSIAKDGYTVTFAKETWASASDTEKAIAITVVAVAGVTMCVVANDTFCALLDNICGVGTTWCELFGGVVAKTLGYTLVDGFYENSIGYNGLISTFLGETVRDTFSKGYPYKYVYFNNVTLGNALSAYDKVITAIENAIGMEFVVDIIRCLG